jgi:hypothetical protein
MAVNNWEKLTMKLLGLKPIKRDPMEGKYPSWLIKPSTDILNVYGTRYLKII